MTILTIIPTTVPFTQNSLFLNDKTDPNLFILNGEYIVSSSSKLSNSHLPYNAFNGTVDKPWICAGDNSSGYTRDPYDDKYTVSKYVGGGHSSTYWKTELGNGDIHIDGEWIQIQLPNPVFLVNYSFLIDNWASNSNGLGKNLGKSLGKSNVHGIPQKFYLVASNDGKNWMVIDQQYLSKRPANINKPLQFNVYTYKSFKMFRLIFHQLFSGSMVALSQFNLKGSSRIIINDEPFSTIKNTIISPSILSSMPEMDNVVPYNKYEIITSTKHIENFDVAANIAAYNKIYSHLKNNHEYSGHYRSDKNTSLKDGITDDTNTMLIQQNNIFLLATLTAAILTIGAISILK